MLKPLLLGLPLLIITGCGSITQTATRDSGGAPNTSSPNNPPITLQAASTSIQAGGTDQLTASQQPGSAPSGLWSVLGGAANGLISASGLYQAPSGITSPTAIVVEFTSGSDTATTSIMVIPIPQNQPVTLQAAQASVQVQSADQITATQQGSPANGGTWFVAGGALNGSIDATGLYQAPAAVPNPGVVTIGYVLGQQLYETQITVTPAQAASAVIQQVSPTSLVALSTPITVSGSNFAPGDMIAVDSVPLATTFVDSSHLKATVVLAGPQSADLQISVQSSATPTAMSNVVSLPAVFPTIQVFPATLAGGPITLNISGTQFGAGDVVTLSGVPLATTVNSSTSITATGFLAPWVSGKVNVEVAGADGLQPLAVQAIPITPTPVSFDAAARFSTQAAFGPRPDVVLAIQHQGFDNWITQQISEPALNLGATDGKRQFIQAVLTGNSLLRPRVALALQSFIVARAPDFVPAATEFENRLEKDSFGNFRDLLTDITSDPNITTFLNLPNNVAATSTLIHPNQNFAREIMQLFSMGPFMLNDDGSVQTDSHGTPVPAYQQETVIDMTRALTGWTYPASVDPAYTIYGVDWSQPLISAEADHDHGAKLLFGAVVLPAGQTAIQDRSAALDAIFQHPSVPPFISHLLIQRLVKSNPSPDYIQRISAVFENNGSGVRGDLGAVVRAILLDPEARSGDTSPSPTDGFLREPYLFQLETMAVLNDLPIDDQPDYFAGTLGENIWEAPTVFGFFSPTYNIPGTSINSPEFGLFNNIAIGLKSDALWNIVMQQQPGFAGYTGNSWLFQNFTTVPTMLDALDHLVYYGRMPDHERTVIANYCSTMNPFDVQAQLQTATFLALDAESNDVSH